MINPNGECGYEYKNVELLFSSYPEALRFL